MKYICVVGLKGAGKDTFSDILASILKTANVVVRCEALATPIKEMLQSMFGVSDEYFCNPVLKELPCDLMRGVTPRRAMQTFGTDWAQSVFGEMIWIDRLVDKTKNSDADFVIVTDIRFQHEYDYFESIGAKFVFIIRDLSSDKEREYPVMPKLFSFMRRRRCTDHVSEAGLMHNYDASRHVLIHNYGTIGDMFTEATHVASTLIAK